MSNCRAMMYTITILADLAFNTTNLLFFFRVRAVYGNSRSVTAFFGVCYVIVFGVSLCEPFALHAEVRASDFMFVRTCRADEEDGDDGGLLASGTYALVHRE